MPPRGPCAWSVRSARSRCRSCRAHSSRLCGRLFPLLFGLAYYALRSGDNLLSRLQAWSADQQLTAPWLSPALKVLAEHFPFTPCDPHYTAPLRTDELCPLLYFLISWHYLAETLHQLAIRVRADRHLHRAETKLLLALVAIQLIAKFALYWILPAGPASTRPWTMAFITLLYLLLNVVSAGIPSFFEFAFFFSEGLFATQFVSDHVASELNFELFMLYLPVLLLLEAFFLATELRGWSASVRSFARVIGKHDAILLFMVFLAVAYFFNFIDALQKAYL